MVKKVSDSDALLEGCKNIVVFLGAGATISEMTCAPKNHRIEPPCDADFLEKARKHKPGLYKSTKKAFAAVWQHAEPYPMRVMRMEQLFASAYWRVSQTKGSSKEGAAARDLLDKLTVLLRETLAQTTGLQNPSQHVALLKSLIRNQCSVTLVSMNYDLLAERALLIGNQMGLWKWNWADGYGFSPINCSKPKVTSNVTLLKLHGSMNWYIENPSKNRDSFYDPKAPIYIPRPARRDGACPWQRKQRIIGHNSRKKAFPLIIPPVFEKGKQIHGQFTDIWKKANKALAQADMLLVWGYSLPPSDYHTEVLLAQTARKAKFKLITVNRDPVALGRVTYACGHKWNRWFFRIGHLIDLI